MLQHFSYNAPKSHKSFFAFDKTKQNMKFGYGQVFLLQDKKLSKNVLWQLLAKLHATLSAQQQCLAGRAKKGKIHNATANAKTIFIFVLQC